VPGRRAAADAAAVHQRHLHQHRPIAVRQVGGRVMCRETRSYLETHVPLDSVFVIHVDVYVRVPRRILADANPPSVSRFDTMFSIAS